MMDRLAHKSKQTQSRRQGIPKFEMRNQHRMAKTDKKAKQQWDKSSVLNGSYVSEKCMVTNVVDDFDDTLSQQSNQYVPNALKQHYGFPTN